MNAMSRSRFAVSAYGLLVLGAIGNAEAQVTFPVAFDAEAMAELTVGERVNLASHLQAAGAQWAAVLDLDGPRSIEIIVVIDNVAPRSGGASVTTGFVGVFGGRNTYEQGAAAELRTGIDPNGAEPDVRISFNTTYLREELWFDPEPLARVAVVDINRTDAMSVALHELGHALAYNGWANGEGTPPQLFWSTFDRWMVSTGSPALFDGPEVARTWGSRPELTSGNIHHWANFPSSERGEIPRQVELQWRDGKPIPSHACAGLKSLDAPLSMRLAQARGEPVPGLIGELMNGVVFYRGIRYEISPLDVAALSDSGLPAITDTVFFDGFEPAP